MLAQYVTDVRNLLNDNQGQFFTEPTVNNYVNRARRRVASVSGCIRVMPPGTYTIPNQEVYPFAGWTALAQAACVGVQSILACRSLTVGIGGSWQGNTVRGGSWKPAWRRIPFTDFQARFRIYGGTFVGTFSEPGWFSQYGLGQSASLYLSPIPTVRNPMEVDLTCVPSPLLTDSDPEPIPYPWVDAVVYWAATLCLMGQQRREDAQAMAALFADELPMCAAVVCPQMIANPYGATLRSA